MLEYLEKQKKLTANQWKIFVGQLSAICSISSIFS
jgi:hypothetical protein